MQKNSLSFSDVFLYINHMSILGYENTSYEADHKVAKESYILPVFKDLLKSLVNRGLIKGSKVTILDAMTGGGDWGHISVDTLKELRLSAEFSLATDIRPKNIVFKSSKNIGVHYIEGPLEGEQTQRAILKKIANNKKPNLITMMCGINYAASYDKLVAQLKNLRSFVSKDAILIGTGNSPTVPTGYSEEHQILMMSAHQGFDINKSGELLYFYPGVTNSEIKNSQQGIFPDREPIPVYHHPKAAWDQATKESGWEIVDWYLPLTAENSTFAGFVAKAIDN